MDNITYFLKAIQKLLELNRVEEASLVVEYLLKLATRQEVTFEQCNIVGTIVESVSDN